MAIVFTAKTTLAYARNFFKMGRVESSSCDKNCEVHWAWNIACIHCIYLKCWVLNSGTVMPVRSSTTELYLQLKIIMIWSLTEKLADSCLKYQSRCTIKEGIMKCGRIRSDFHAILYRQHLVALGGVRGTQVCREGKELSGVGSTLEAFWWQVKIFQNPLHLPTVFLPDPVFLER